MEAKQFSVTVSFTYEGLLRRRALRNLLSKKLSEIEGVEPGTINVEDPDIDIDPMATYSAEDLADKGIK